MNETLPVSISGPALIFGGNYGNLEATGAVLAQAKRLGIDPGNVVCTGDLIAYCADPLATVEVMRRSSAHVVMGNCEESIGQSSDQCGCGFEAGSACDLLAAEWYAFASRMLDDDARAWMRKLPRSLHLHIAGRRLAVIHGGARRINRYVFASTPPDIKREEIELTGCDGVLSGHCGLPFTEIVGGHLWHNAGAIGHARERRHAAHLVQHDCAKPRRTSNRTARPRLRFRHHRQEDAPGGTVRALCTGASDRLVAELRHASPGGAGTARTGTCAWPCRLVMRHQSIFEWFA